MAINDALVCRTAYTVDDYVILAEVWDMTHQDCPFASMGTPSPQYARWVRLSRPQYAHMFGEQALAELE